VSGTPYRTVDFPPVDLDIERRPDGVIVMTPRESLRVDTPSVPEGLARQAARLGDKTHLAERGPDGEWLRHSFAEMKADTDAVTQWLIEQDIPAGRPVLIVSGNSIAHAVMRYGAMAAGVPVCPVSANYALMGAAGGFERLRYVVGLVRPAVIFAENEDYAAAVAAVASPGTTIVSRAAGAFPAGTMAYDDIISTRPTHAVAERIAALDPDAPAAYMLTSGSTGRPKAVVQTQRMLVSNLHQGWQVLGRAAGWDDALLEWLPWSHVSGAFSSMAAAIFGGSFYIDNGKPLPGRFDETIRNLREIPLKYFTNVPAGYAMLADALETDDVLRETFFRDLRLMLYGGAGLPQPLFDRIQDLAVRTIGKRVFFTTGYGATETTSGCMAIYFDTDKVGVGLPMPGLSVKLVPTGDRYELRMKGPMVTPGYLDAPDLNATIRDDENFYKIGDTVRFHDPDDPAQGLAFAGRLAEEFKLATGAWVAGGVLRADIVKALSPLVTDVLICGENRGQVGILAWPNAKGVATETKDASLTEALNTIRDRLTTHNAAHPGLSTRVARFAFITDPPNAEAHEVSDKGTINQALAIRRRSADVERLYAPEPANDVLDLGAFA